MKIRAKLAKVPELQSKAGAGMFSVVGMGESDEEEEEEEGDMVAEDDEGDDFGHGLLASSNVLSSLLFVYSFIIVFN